MRRIGLKSLTLIAALAVFLLIAAHERIFDIRRVLALQPAVLWLIGFLASFMGFALSFLVKSHRESSQNLGFGPSEERPAGSSLILEFRDKALWMGPRDQVPAWELSRSAYTLVASLAFLLGGFVLLENRSLILLGHFYHNMSKDYGHICPKEGESPPIDVAPKPEKFGCELVKKAYALGYTKDLGDCAEDADEAKEEVCTHRQWDEPSSHYSYRLIERFFASPADQEEGKKTSLALSPSALIEGGKSLPELGRHHADGFAGEARSSFHIFTDLPAPGGAKEKWRRVLHPNHCQDDLRELRFRLAERGRDAGSQLEDAIAHLLFNPLVGRDSSYCRLYTIHWGAAPSTCEDLARSGRLALRVYGIEETVLGVLERQQREKNFPPPQTKAQEPEGKEKERERERVSFHCLMSREVQASRSSIELEGQRFVVSTELLPPATQDGLMPSQALLQAVGRAFVPGFTYTHIDRKLPFTLSEERFKTEIARSGEHLRLAKYELLKMSDILAGDQWIASYPEYMEVYPWQSHLSNFVSRFRRAFEREGDQP